MTVAGLAADLVTEPIDKLLRLWLFVYTTPPPQRGW